MPVSRLPGRDGGDRRLEGRSDRAKARQWPVRLATAAEEDLTQILAWTSANLGEMQARIYAETLSAALEALVEGPAILGAKERPDIGRWISTFHIARHGREGRHFVMFRVGRHLDQDVIDVLCVLYDTMDLQRHSSRTLGRLAGPIDEAFLDPLPDAELGVREKP